ncbi:MAG: DnaJ domain-containing protein [Actinobacteria bacterium]|uniref:Unannotated protein n=1 Tax=freshwater metagenome TaxID=449393 RepID=A0A6J6UXD5_9ZZZZ|nr:DnaJ domain-containing protein [Actinomycetota bacterium]
MSATDDRSYYQVLGLSQGASAQEIREAHRQLARLLHPDRLGQATAAEQALAERRMREVNVAWTTLSDVGRRSDYDRSLRAQRTSPSSQAPQSGGFSTGSGPGSSRGAGAGVDDSYRDPQTGRPEEEHDPDAFYAKLRQAELDPDEEPLSEWHFWLLRRGPLVAAVLLGLFLFVATAYAGGNRSTSETASEQAVATSAPDRNCVRITSGRTATRVTCGSPNDGHIVTKVPVALECPAQTSYVVLEDEFFCVSTDPAVVGSPAEPTGG